MPVLVVDDPVDLLAAQPCEPIEATQELHARSVRELDGGSAVFDFGQNLAGRVRLSVQGPAGTRVVLRFGERLDEHGHVDQSTLRGARPVDVCVLGGRGPQTWEPNFTYHGFRFCEVSGYPGRPGPDALVARVLHSAAAEIGHFECSNDLLNAIHRSAVWSQRSNLFGLLTDCAQRDERLGWTGDAQLFAATACWNMQMGALLSKWMGDLRDAQSAGGAVPDVVPVADQPARAGNLGWGDACTIVPWTVYQFCGDSRIIEDNYSAMTAWLRYTRRSAREGLCGLETYGDWVALVDSPKAPIADAYYYYSHRLMAEMAAIIGRSAEAAQFSHWADEIAAAYEHAYWNADAQVYAGDTQTTNLLPIVFGLAPPERRAALAAQIARDIARRENHLSTGFIGTSYLLPVLSAQGQHDVAYQLAMQESAPSWGYMIRHGATTIWERWDSDTIRHRMNSHNQIVFAAVDRWFYEYLGGIRADLPGFKRILIAPRPAGDLQWARAQYESMYGLIRSEWERTDDVFSMRVVIPSNTSARVAVPTLRRVNPRITESQAVVFDDGKPRASADGVLFLSSNDEHVTFETGSGDFTFEMRGH
jgi:alpha-L-rhamnosidase